MGLFWDLPGVIFRRFSGLPFVDDFWDRFFQKSWKTQNVESAQSTTPANEFEGSAGREKQTETSKKTSKKLSKKHRRFVPKRLKNTKNTGMIRKCLKNQLGEPTFGPEVGFGSIFG